jgi:pyruvate kinase
MQGAHISLEEPIHLLFILEPSKENFFPTMTKIIGTLGPQSRSVKVIKGFLKAGMFVTHFDFSGGDNDYHQETLENLKIVAKGILCWIQLVQN